MMDDNDDVGDHQHRPAPPPRGSTASSNAPPTLAPSPSSTIRTPTHSLPSSRPTSVVGFPASSRPISSSTAGSARLAAAPTNRTHVKFVYANGTEEVLPPRDSSEIGSATTSPQLPSSPFAGPSNPRSHSPSHSPTRVAYPLSPIVPPLGAPSSPPPSYFQRHAGPAGSSRRSSIDAKPRHSRGLSIGSVVDLPIAIPTNRETDDADDEAHHGSGDNGSRGGRRGRHVSSSDEEAEGNDDDADEPEEAHPPPMTAAERIKLMEERSAASRRERKVLQQKIKHPLERCITNFSFAGYGFGDIERIASGNQQDP